MDDDWNALTGGNTDLSDLIYCIGIGKVVFTEDLAGSWGNLVRIVHYLYDGKTYESVNAHCVSITAKLGDWV